MTAEQQALMIRIFQFGFASGLTDRFDMIRRYYQGYPELRSDIIAAATAFEWGCGYCHEQTEHLRDLSENQFAVFVWGDPPGQIGELVKVLCERSGDRLVRSESSDPAKAIG